MKNSNNIENITNSIRKLQTWVEKNKFRGYDPYDGLRSPYLRSINGRNRYFPLIFLQFNKKSPINFRPLLLIKRSYNPKALGLFLSSYSILFKITGNKRYLRIARALFGMLCKLQSKNFSGSCWGYNFDYETPLKFVKKFTPSVVVTAFVVKGLYDFFQISNESKVKDMIISSKNFILKDIEISDFGDEICFSYTPVQLDLVHNANLLGAEVLSIVNLLKPSDYLKNLIIKSLNYTVRRQNENGSWYYRIDPKSNISRKQIDFHQGYVLDSIKNCIDLLDYNGQEFNLSLERGLNFYINNQFKQDGSSYWRWPRYWPIEIHNQSQGIITLCNHHSEKDNLLGLANQIANFTINKMQSNSGYFIYQKWPMLNNNIPYMRWSQAWMMLSLTKLLKKSGEKIETVN